MPFQRPPASIADVGIVGVWITQPCFGETNSGDGLFQEYGRADGAKLYLLIDVMGHGDNAAQTVELIETRLLPDSHCQGLAPADLLKTLHGMLESEYAATGRFVTALALLVDGTQGTVVASNAAVPEPLLGEPGGSWQTWSISGVAPLGLPIPDMDFADTLRSLAPGEHLLAFTDGVTEAGVMCGKDQFQHGHLHTCLNGLPAGTSVDQVVEALRQAVQGHVGANWPEDDTTVLGIQRT